MRVWLDDATVMPSVLGLSGGAAMETPSTSAWLHRNRVMCLSALLVSRILVTRRWSQNEKASSWSRTRTQAASSSAAPVPHSHMVYVYLMNSWFESVSCMCRLLTIGRALHLCQGKTRNMSDHSQGSERERERGK